MKYLLYSILALFASPLFAKCIIIEKRVDKDLNVTYHVSYYINADGSAKIVDYKTTDDVSKLLSISGKANTGLSKDADFTIMYLNEDGTVNRADSKVKAVDKNASVEQVIKTSTEIQPKDNQDASVLSQELDSKPETIDPKPIAPASDIVDAKA